MDTFTYGQNIYVIKRLQDYLIQIILFFIHDCMVSVLLYDSLGHGPNLFNGIELRRVGWDEHILHPHLIHSLL